jgi:probable HAF family extracellular repeat protein
MIGGTDFVPLTTTRVPPMIRFFSVVLLVFAFEQVGRAQVHYTVKTLGIISLGEPTNLNQLGQVVATSTVNDHAKFWNGSSVVDLGTLGIPPNAGARATGINDLSQIVGQSSAPGSPSGFTTTAMIWQSGSMTNLGIPGIENFATDINNSGDVAGWFFNPTDSKVHAFFRHAAVVQDIGALNRTSRATAVNSSGAVVGWTSTQTTNVEHAFIWKNGVMTDLGTAPDTPFNSRLFESYANDINDLGQVVGYALSPTAAVATVWNDGVLSKLPLPSGAMFSQARGINNHGVIVGTGDAIPGFSNIALVWDNGQVYVLDTLVDNLDDEWQRLNFADAINDAGQIVGIGTRKGNNRNEVFLLTPVPEPSTCALAALGALGLLIAARRDR